MGHPISGPFTESWDGLDDFSPPDPYDETRYRFWKGLMKLMGKNRYLLGFLYIGFINNVSAWLRGFSKIMVDYVRNPNKVHQLNGIITEHFCKQITIMKESCPKLDALFALDDLGTQKSPIISPKTFRKFIR